MQSPKPFETSRQNLNAYFEALQLSRATPVVRLFLMLGIAVSLLSFLLDVLIVKQHLIDIFKVRVFLTALLGGILFFFWSPFKTVRLSLEPTVLLSLVCVSVCLTLIYSIFSDFYYIITIKLSLCLFALVVIQMGVKLVIKGCIIITLLPSVLLLFTPASNETMLSFLVFHAMWSGCAILAAYLFHKHNHRMFLFERQLYDINRMAVKAQEDELKASQEKSRFVANMSHEIRTPLTAIMGYAESLIHDQNSYQDIKHALTIIHRNSQHLLSITNDVLDLSKVEAGKLQIKPVPSSVFTVVDETESLLQKQAEDNRVIFNVNYEFPLPESVEFDPLRLRQILFNVCSNAIKFSQGGEVTLEVSANDNMKILMFKVIDDGIGMDQQTVRNLFRPFAQGDISTTRRYGGTGLGLYIAFQLAKRMEGDIRVVSEKGKGSEFSIILPLKIQMETIWLDDKPIQIKTEPHDLESFQPLSGKVLLAEDQVDNQRLIEALLTRLGVTVVTVSNGEEALQKTLSDHFDLILMDMQMPVMDGLEATKLILGSGSKTPIVALSANVMKQDVDAYKNLGCVESLSKPIDRHELYQCLKNYLTVNSNDDSSNVVDFYQSDAMKQLSKDYLIRLEEDYNKLTSAITRIDWEAITRPAHRVKGAAGNFKLSEVSTTAAVIEKAAKECRETLMFALKQLDESLNSEKEKFKA